MILSRSKPVPGESARKSASKKEVPTLEEFLTNRDYTGALTLLEFNDTSGTKRDSQLWIAYCAFHLGDYKKAAEIYERLSREADAGSGASTTDDQVDKTFGTYLACCYFYMGMYPESQKMLADEPESSLKTRLSLHLVNKLLDELELQEYEEKLQDTVEDRLCLASVLYLRAHYQGAIDIYKSLLLENKDYLALNVYEALCFYKLDYYDSALESLQKYLQRYPDSPTAINLKVCNHFRFYKSTAEIAEMRQLIDKVFSSSLFGNDLIQHNTVVFRNGEGALQILPNLVDVIPEARLNLVIYYLRQNDTQEAYDLIKDLEPTLPQDFILKGIVNAIIGQDRKSQDCIKVAQQYFQLIGTSNSECDTIPGRQCMASFYFLYSQFKDVLVYLNSIKTYFSNVDVFNFNYAQAQVATGHLKEAEEAFLGIRNEKYRSDCAYIAILSYVYIMNKKSQLAWELYLKMEPSSESFNVLQLIANTCYTVGDFWYAAKAFDMLERLDPSPEHWEGKRGACCGTFQYIVAKKLPKELLTEVIKILKNTSNSQVEQIIRVMKKWGKENRIAC